MIDAILLATATKCTAADEQLCDEVVDRSEPFGDHLIIEISDAELAKHADAIRGLRRRSVESIVEIGRRLTEVKVQLRHGRWLSWLKNDLKCSDETARRYMRMRDFVESRSVWDFEAFEITALEILSRASTPELVRPGATVCHQPHGRDGDHGRAGEEDCRRHAGRQAAMQAAARAARFYLHQARGSLARLGPAARPITALLALESVYEPHVLVHRER